MSPRPATTRLSMRRLRRQLLGRLQSAVRQCATAAGERLPLLTWGRKYLPEHFAAPPSAMHRWLEAEFAAMEHERGTKLNVIGPRGSAKSTLGTLAWPLRLAVEGAEPYIWIISDTKPQALAHLANLRNELLDNPRLARDYPSAVGPGVRWRGPSIILANGVTIEAFGIGQRIRGRRRGAARPSLIICDDLQNDRHIVSALQRERSREWFHGMLLKAGNRLTNVVNLGTVLHREALMLELNRTPGWRSRIFRAIERWPENMTLWSEWEQLYTNLDDAERAAHAREFYDQHFEEMTRGAVVLWPEQEDLYALMQMRVESGRTSFEREKQGSPLAPELCEWPAEYFDEPLWFDAWPARTQLRTMALDPSKGADAARSDYSAYVMLAVDRQGVLYVQADLARRPLAQMVADGVELFAQFRPDGLAIESNHFQELLAPLFADEAARRGMLPINPWLLNNTTNKQTRIRRLGAYLAGHRLRFKAGCPSTELLVQQLQEFPLADHDDGPDALEMAIRLAAELLNGPSDDGLGRRLPLSG